MVPLPFDSMAIPLNESTFVSDRIDGKEEFYPIYKVLLSLEPMLSIQSPLERQNVIDHT
jgi:hypothetical protein